MINGAHTIQEELGGVMVWVFLMDVTVMLGELLSLTPSDLRRHLGLLVGGGVLRAGAENGSSLLPLRLCRRSDSLHIRTLPPLACDVDLRLLAEARIVYFQIELAILVRVLNRAVPGTLALPTSGSPPLLCHDLLWLLLPPEQASEAAVLPVGIVLVLRVHDWFQAVAQVVLGRLREVQRLPQAACLLALPRRPRRRSHRRLPWTDGPRFVAREPLGAVYQEICAMVKTSDEECAQVIVVQRAPAIASHSLGSPPALSSSDGVPALLQTGGI